jgi:phosphatidylglycerol:prolipoprotein diacylglycerol transferase
MFPVLFRVGPLTIYSYGTMMAIAFLVAGFLTSRELDRKGLPSHHASNMVFWAAVGGIVGSRLWAIAEDWRVFLADPLSMIFSGAGFVWYGGLLGGILAVYWVVRRHALPWLVVTDCVAPSLALAHAIGRIGCQLAGDGDWGSVTNVPWGMAYPNAIVGWDYPPGVRVHPTPIYETLAYTAIFAVLWSLRKRPAPDGALFWWYLALAPAARFLIEFVRINPTALFGLSQAQLFSLLLVVLATWQLIAGRGSRLPATGPAARTARR